VGLVGVGPGRIAVAGWVSGRGPSIGDGTRLGRWSLSPENRTKSLYIFFTLKLAHGVEIDRSNVWEFLLVNLLLHRLTMARVQSERSWVGRVNTKGGNSELPLTGRTDPNDWPSIPVSHYRLVEDNGHALFNLELTVFLTWTC
jgi:hypothetical protein